jgi:hypothetical protein
MSRAILPNYEGLESIPNPILFEKYVHSVKTALETYFRCIIEVAENCGTARIAYQETLRGVRPFDRSLRASINLLVSAVSRELRAACGALPAPFDWRYERYHDRLQQHPHIVIAVAFGLSVYQQERKLADGVCQLPMDTVFDLVDNLVHYPDEWVMDRLDQLHNCPAET